MDNGLCTPRHPGCTNSRANNYGAFYNVDDGSCKIGGCQATDPEATYNVPCLCTQTCAANSARRALRSDRGDAGRRSLQVSAASSTDNCLDPSALNYNANATGDGSDCAYTKAGCTDSAAINFDPGATEDDLGCEYHVYGCTDPAAAIYDSLATALLRSTYLRGCYASKAGCTDSNSARYVPSANAEDGSCVYEVYGCTEASAFNFDSLATVSTGCVMRVAGCMDSTAKNYAPDANVATECTVGTFGCNPGEGARVTLRSWSWLWLRTLLGLG